LDLIFNEEYPEEEEEELGDRVNNKVHAEILKRDTISSSALSSRTRKDIGYSGDDRGRIDLSSFPERESMISDLPSVISVPLQVSVKLPVAATSTYHNKNKQSAAPAPIKVFTVSVVYGLYRLYGLSVLCGYCVLLYVYYEDMREFQSP